VLGGVFAGAPNAIRARLALSAAGLAVELARGEPFQAKRASFWRCHRRHPVPGAGRPSEQRPRPVWVIEESLEVMPRALGSPIPDLLRRGEPELARRSDELGGDQ